MTSPVNPEELFQEYKEHPLMVLAVVVATAAITGGHTSQNNLKDALEMTARINLRFIDMQDAQKS